MPNFAKQLAAYLEGNGLTGRAFARELGVSEASVSGWLAGLHEPIGDPRVRLVKLGLIDAPAASAVGEVLAYVREHPGRVPSRIALDLGLTGAQVSAALRNLRRQGRVEPASHTREAWPTKNDHTSGGSGHV